MGHVHVVVDGSNIATEGRTAPSLEQLDAAVRSFVGQYGYEKVTVIVDATFGHRITAAERNAFEEAILNGELVTPPAGTIGRGDAFILQVARLADADVLSNDSFQELHAEHTWLFEPGRLWGGKPVPEVGWVFVPRAPVRGVTSRRAVEAAKRATKATKATKAAKAKAASAPRKSAPAKAAKAKDETSAPASTRRRRRRGTAAAREPVNTQQIYAAFVVEHPIGAAVTGTVERFSSHGAYVRVNGAAAYVPLRSLGDPPPRSAREVLTLGDERIFVVTRFDPNIRGIDVALADVDATTTSAPPGAQAAAAVAAESRQTDAEEAPVSPAAKKATRKKASARKATAKKKSTAKRAPARKAAAKKSVAKRSAKKATAKKTAKKKTAAKRAPARKKATARKATAKKRTAKKTAAKRATKKR